MKMKAMILCTGIKGVGAYDGEIVIRLLPNEWHPGTMVAAAKHGDVIVLKDHEGVLYTPSFHKPFSYALSSQSSKIMHLTQCLSALDVISKKSLVERMRALEVEGKSRELRDKTEQLKRDCKDLGIALTVRQLQVIGRGLRTKSEGA